MQNASLLSIKGWLQEVTNKFYHPNRWYCKLEVNQLFFYNDEDDNSIPVKVIPMDQIENVDQLIDTSLPGFSLKVQNQESNTKLFCKNVHEAERWICALKVKPTDHRININDFKILKLIGEGFGGKVFLARMKTNGKLFAIKAIDKERMLCKGNESRLVAERNILMRAKHQFITRLFYAFQDSNQCYLVLEYVAGGDLRYHLENQSLRFSKEQIRLYLAEIIVALRTLHKMGIIYRDLKPENILLDLKGHIKLADFGLSRQVDPGKDCKSLCGTFEYLAPEMIKNENQTFCIDYWALGILSYRLIVGYMPFQSGNKRILFNKIKESPVRFPQNIDPVSVSFISALLEKDPTKRLGSIGTNILLHPFFAGIDWNLVSKMQTKPEFIPYISKDDSVSNFCEEITSRPVPNNLSRVSDPKSFLYVRSFSFVDKIDTNNSFES